MPVPDFEIDWSHVFVVAALLALTWLAIAAVGAVQRRVLRRHPVDIEDNLAARRVQTQARVLGRLAQFAIGLVGVSLALMTFPAVRQLGTTLLASAGIIGLVAGIAAKPVFGNLIAGLQIALTSNRTWMACWFASVTCATHTRPSQRGSPSQSFCSWSRTAFIGVW